MTKLIIQIPCFNEAGRIPLDTFGEFVRGHPDIGFVLVDDGSKGQVRFMLDFREGDTTLISAVGRL